MAEGGEGPDTQLARPTLRGAAGVVGVGLAVVYAIGFVVSNVHFGALWLVDPSLLQARYASAGILWAVFLGTSVIPAYYAIDFWRAAKEGPEDPVGEDGADRWRPFSSQLEKIRESGGMKRLWRVAVLVFWVVGFLWMAFLFISPLWLFMLLVVLGVNPFQAVFPTLVFHFAILGLAFLSHWSGMTLKEHLDFRDSPYRAVSLVAVLIIHAGAFGYFIYPIVPARSGGARPLPARIVMDSGAAVASSVDELSGAGDRAYVVTSTNEYLVAMVPRSQENTDATIYCAVAVRHENVAAIIVQPYYPLFRPEASGWMRDLVNSPAPRIDDCR